MRTNQKEKKIDRIRKKLQEKKLKKLHEKRENRIRLNLKWNAEICVK